MSLARDSVAWVTVEPIFVTEAPESSGPLFTSRGFVPNPSVPEAIGSVRPHGIRSTEPSADNLHELVFSELSKGNRDFHGIRISVINGDDVPPGPLSEGAVLVDNFTLAPEAVD